MACCPAHQRLEDAIEWRKRREWEEKHPEDKNKPFKVLLSDKA